MKERNIRSQSWGATGNSYKSPNLRTDQTATLFSSVNKQTNNLVPFFYFLTLYIFSVNLKYSYFELLSYNSILKLTNLKIWENITRSKLERSINCIDYIQFGLFALPFNVLYLFKILKNEINSIQSSWFEFCKLQEFVLFFL